VKETWWQRGSKGLWPDVNILEGAKAASNCGYWAAVFVAGGTAFVILLGQLGYELEPGHFGIEAIVDVTIFAAIAWGIARYSRFAAILGLVVFLLERLYSWYSFGIGGMGVAAIFVLLFVNGIRGNFAYQRHRMLDSSVEIK